ncbi:MAG: sortase [bacterium]|nr:sortase [bacterium]
MTIHKLFSSAGADPSPLASARQWRFAFTARFFATWLILAVLLLVLLYSAGLVPRGVAELGDQIASLVTGRRERPPNPGAVIPTPRIIIPTIAVTAPVIFPESADLAALNAALLQGVVHYPGSALPGDPGTVFLFGHSTGLAVVHNKNFEVFNRLSELRGGDIVRLAYGEREYWYRVRSIELKRTDAAVIDLAPSGVPRLVLTTCNVFGGVDDRFIVTADFMESHPLERTSR